MSQVSVTAVKEHRPVNQFMEYAICYASKKHSNGGTKFYCEPCKGVVGVSTDDMYPCIVTKILFQWSGDWMLTPPYYF